MAPRKRSSSKTSPVRDKKQKAAETPSSPEQEIENNASEDNDDGVMKFSQLEPEPSQSLPEAKRTERTKCQELNPDQLEKAVKTLSRLIFFKATAGEFFERRKVIAEIENDLGEFFTKNKKSLTNGIFELAQERLEAVFGFQIKAVPPNMIESLPARYKDRYYVTNPISDEIGTHAKRLHGMTDAGCKEKGLLMAVLAFAFCKGSPRSHDSGAGMRWISDEALYRLLNSVDDNISEDPPIQKSFSTKRNPSTKEVDTLMDKFVHTDYLVREKIQDAPNSSAGDGSALMYAMGPRSALEIGRKQLIYFCAEILDEQPDPTMLAEIDVPEEE